MAMHAAPRLHPVTSFDQITADLGTHLAGRSIIGDTAQRKIWNVVTRTPTTPAIDIFLEQMKEGDEKLKKNRHAAAAALYAQATENALANGLPPALLKRAGEAAFGAFFEEAKSWKKYGQAPLSPAGPGPIEQTAIYLKLALIVADRYHLDPRFAAEIYSYDRANRIIAGVDAERTALGIP